MLLLLPILAAFASAEVICNPNVPRTALPELASCDYAISYLEYVSATCGSEAIIFTALPAGPSAILLPLSYVGQGPDYTPSSPHWCIILVLWQPRPESRLPPPTLADVFPFDAVVDAAKSIREVCLTEGHGWIPMIGRSWIEPNEWIDVQFGVVTGSDSVDGKFGISGADGGNMTVLLADGSTRTLVPSLFERNNACGGLDRLGSEGLAVLE